MFAVIFASLVWLKPEFFPIQQVKQWTDSVTGRSTPTPTTSPDTTPLNPGKHSSKTSKPKSTQGSDPTASPAPNTTSGSSEDSSVMTSSGKLSEKDFGPIRFLPHATKDTGKYVALTFDDGPGEWTSKVLDVLDSEDIKATFLVVGNEAQSHQSMMKTLVDKGMSVQWHSATHESYTKMTPSQLQNDLSKMREIFSNQGLPTPTCVRPPYGNTSPSVTKILNQNNLHQLLWSVDSEDWRKPGVPKIIQNVNRDLSNHAIILFHDGGGNRDQSVAALKKTIQELKKQNYKFALPCGGN